jgi:hypothetical protein
MQDVNHVVWLMAITANEIIPAGLQICDKVG